MDGKTLYCWWVFGCSLCLPCIVGFVECELFLVFTMDELIHLFLNHQRVAKPVRMVGEVSIDVFVLFIVIYLGNL